MIDNKNNENDIINNTQTEEQIPTQDDITSNMPTKEQIPTQDDITNNTQTEEQNNIYTNTNSSNTAIYTTSANNTAQLDTNSYGQSVYTKEPEVITQNETIQDFKTNLNTSTNTNNNQANESNFYSETIKNTPNAYSNYKKTKQKSKFKRTVAAAVAVAICGGTSIGLGLGLSAPIANAFFPEFSQVTETPQIPETKNDFSFSQTSATVATQAQTPEEKAVSDTNVLDAMSNLLVDVVKKVEPSVVNITSIVVESNNFFNIPVEGESLGSGIIFNQDGNTVYIVTNYHVIGGASEVRILVSGAEELVNAKLVGRQPESDLAVISVSMDDLRSIGVDNVTVAQFGDSESMQVGEMVLAIGNMLGEGNTATIGVVSAMDKTITVDGKTLEVMQTDAVINPGNSGGALVNLQGEVVGINTAKLASYSSQEAIDGIGYSIPTQVAIPIIENLRNGVAQAYMGVEGMTIDEQTASMYNIPSIGVLVRSTTEGSAAEAAGILSGDIITGFNGHSVFQWEDLSSGIKALSPGDEVEVKIVRNGKLVTLNVTLGEYNDGF